MIFNDPRRFGVMDLLRRTRCRRIPRWAHWVQSRCPRTSTAPRWPGMCAPEDLAEGRSPRPARRGRSREHLCRVKRCTVAGLSPERLASTIATPAGVPRPAAHRLASAIKQVLEEAIARASGARYRSSRFRVYDREGARCRRRGCRGVMRRKTQAGRSTFYCRCLPAVAR